jgi:hypothetical protein
VSSTTCRQRPAPWCARRPRPGSANRSPPPNSVQRPAVRISSDPDPGMKDAIPSGNCNSGQRLRRARRTMKHLNIGVPRCTSDLVERPRVRRHRLGLGFPVDTTFTRIPGGRGGISRYAVRSSCDHAASPFMPPQWQDRRPFGKTPVPTLPGGAGSDTTAWRSSSYHQEVDRRLMRRTGRMIRLRSP